MSANLSVIIVSYNTAELLSNCLASLEQQRSSIREIIVFDNASSDHSVDMVKRHFPGVSLLASTENIGFGQANNLALARNSSPLLFLLNPDTVIAPGCIGAIEQYMQTHPEIGLAGTATFNSDGTLQETVKYTYPGHRYGRKVIADLPGDIAWLLGSGLVVRRDIMERVSGFDPDFFLYGEDIDLCLRVRKAGWPLGYITGAKIMHIGGQSERSTPPDVLFAKKMRAELLFYNKHYSPAAVRKIARNRHLEAGWRRVCLRLKGLVGKSCESDRLKQIKYCVASEIFGQGRR